MVERDRERRQKEFDKKVKSNSYLFNDDTDSESENFEPRKKKYKSSKTLDSSDSEGNISYMNHKFYDSQIINNNSLCIFFR